jgi:predicted DNA-binding protein
LTRKIKLNYRIRPELDDSLAEYARAKGQTRTDIITSIIEKYLSCKKFNEKLKKRHSDDKIIEKQDISLWRRKGDYILPSQHSKIKFIAISCKISPSEVMDDILASYLSKVNPNEVFEKALEKVFG